MSAVQRRSFIGSALAAALLTTRRFGEAQQFSSLRIGTVGVDAGAEPYYADALGYFRDAGINAQIQSFTNGAVIASGVASAAIDVGFANILTLAQAYERGLVFDILFPAGVYDVPSRYTVAWVIASDSAVRTASDLNGKTVAVNGIGTLTQLGALAWLDANGADSKTIRFVEFGTTALLAAVEQHRVDAGITTEPFISSAHGRIRVLAPALDSIAKEFVTGVWFSSRPWVAANANLASGFITALRLTARWANKHHSESASILAKATGVDADVVGRMTRTTYGEAVDFAKMQPEIDVAVKYGMLTSVFPVQEIVARVPAPR